MGHIRIRMYERTEVPFWFVVLLLGAMLLGLALAWRATPSLAPGVEAEIQQWQAASQACTERGLTPVRRFPDGHIACVEAK